MISRGKLSPAAPPVGQRHLFALFLALAGLACQVIVSAFAVPAAFAALRAEALPPGYSAVVICTAAGMKRIVIDADGNRVEGQGGGEAEACFACHFTGTSALQTAAQGRLALPAFGSLPRFTPLVALADGQTASQSPDCRGPPASSI